MRNRAIVVCILAASIVGSVRAADLTGVWTAQTVDRNGDPQDVSFRFTQSGDAISGKMYGENESTPISEGTVKDGQIRFVVVTELNGQIIRTIYSGHTVASADNKSEEIELARAREGAKNTDRKAPPIRLHRVA